MRSRVSSYPVEGFQRSAIASGLLGLLLLGLGGGPPAWAQDLPRPDTLTRSTESLSLPGADWRLELDLGGFTLVRDQTRPDQEARTSVFRHRGGRLDLEVVMRPAVGSLGPIDYRAARWKRLVSLDPPEERPRLWERGDVAFLEFWIGSRRHVTAFLRQESTRIEVRVTCACTVSDEPELAALLDSIAVGENPRRRWFRRRTDR